MIVPVKMNLNSGFPHFLIMPERVPTDFIVGGEVFLTPISGALSLALVIVAIAATVLALTIAKRLSFRAARF